MQAYRPKQETRPPDADEELVIPKAIMRDDDLGAALKVAYGVLWSWAGRTGKAITFRTEALAEACGESAKAARNWIRRLERLGKIRVIDRTRSGRKNPMLVEVRPPGERHTLGSRDPQLTLEFEEDEAEEEVPALRIQGGQAHKVGPTLCASDGNQDDGFAALSSAGSPSSATDNGHEGRAAEDVTEMSVSHDTRGDPQKVAHGHRVVGDDEAHKVGPTLCASGAPKNERTNVFIKEKNRSFVRSGSSAPEERARAPENRARDFCARVEEIAIALRDPTLGKFMIVLALERALAGAVSQADVARALDTALAAPKPGTAWNEWLMDLFPDWRPLSRFAALKVRLAALGIAWRIQWQWPVGRKALEKSEVRSQKSESALRREQAADPWT